MKIVFSAAILLLLCSGIFGQKNEIEIETHFSGNMGPRPLSLPEPKYPRAKILPGVISVAVSVDENGEVLSATDVTGPYPVCKSVDDPIIFSLRAAAQEAARKSKFEPAIIDEKPVKVDGRIYYTLVSPKIALRVLKNAKPDRLTKIGLSDAGASITPVDTDRKTGSSGLLNRKAVSIGKPSYPAAAKAVGATGTVKVQVLIDEKGNMYSAEAMSGHPLFRRAAENAACDSRFTPTLLSGQPVKVSGFITYNFVP